MVGPVKCVKMSVVRLFLSSTPTDARPDNTPTSFKATLRDEGGRLMGVDEVVDVGLASLWVDKASVRKEDVWWAIKSNIVRRKTVPSAILETFHLSDLTRARNIKVTEQVGRYQIDFLRPFYHRVCWRELVTADAISFDLWDMREDKRVVSLPDAASTIMLLNIKGTDSSRRHQESLTLSVTSNMAQMAFPNNNGAHFTFPLPQPWSNEYGGGGGGQLSIHSLHIPRVLVGTNVMDRCSISVEDSDGKIHHLGYVHNWSEGTPGVVANLRQILAPVKVGVKVSGGGIVTLTRIDMVRNVQSIHLSTELSQVLGYQRTDLTLRGIGGIQHTATRRINLGVGKQPDFLILSIDVVKPCLFLGRQWINFAKIVSLARKTNSDAGSTMRHYFYGSGHEPVQLRAGGVFEQIHVSLLDGDTLKPVYFAEEGAVTQMLLTLETK